MTTSDSEKPVQKAGEAPRGLRLIKASYSLALLLEVIPVELGVIDYLIRFGGFFQALAAKAVFLTVILLPLLVFFVRNGLRVPEAARWRIAVIVAVILANLAFNSWAVYGLCRANARASGTGEKGPVGVQLALQVPARTTMDHFLRIYSVFASVRSLAFPVRYAPVNKCYDGVNGNGKALYSWRVEIGTVCYPDHSGWDLSQPWDSGVNRGLSCLNGLFSADQTPPREDSVRCQRTFPDAVALAIVGPGTAFGEGKTRTPLKGLPPSAVLLVEARASGVPWPAPGDLDVRTMPHTINAPDGKGISGRAAGGFVVLFADGQAWFLSEKVPFDALSNFFTTDGAKRHDREKLLGPFALDRRTDPGVPAGLL